MIVDVAPGLWVWRVEHPDYAGDPEWEPTVNCTCVESRGVVALLDPLDGGDGVAERLDARPPTYIAILKPDHVRHVDAFAARYDVPAYGPVLYWRDDVPELELELPFELVIVSHGEPVHDRAAFERALELPTWGDFQPGDG